MFEGYQYAYARLLSAAMASDEFVVVSTEDYLNEFGIPGIEYRCNYRGREFFLSESRTTEPSVLKRFARVLSDSENIAIRKPMILQNRFGQFCLYLEAWYCGQWFKFHTPVRSGPKDEFTQLTKNALNAELRKLGSPEL